MAVVNQLKLVTEKFICTKVQNDEVIMLVSEVFLYIA